MHKLRLLIVLTAISWSSLAQEQEAASRRFPTQMDNKLAGINAMLLYSPGNYHLNPAEKDFHVGAGARAGYFVSNNLALGATVLVSNEHSEWSRSRSRHIKVGAFGRYYLGNAIHKSGKVNKLRPFVEGGTAVGVVSFISDDYSSAIGLLDLRITPGINYFITPRIALESGLSIIFEFPGNSDRARIIYSPNLGVHVFFGGR